MYIFCTFMHSLVQIMYNVNMNIGKKLKELRIQQNLTQEMLSDLLGISRLNYTRYENDKVRPDYETLIKIADFYDVSLDDLFDRK